MLVVMLMRLMLVISREKEVVKSEVRRGGGVTLASSSLLREALARYQYNMPVDRDMFPKRQNF